MKVDRILSIIMLLLNRKKISAPELSKIFDVSVRTIYRDVETINQAGIPIVAETGVKGGISILEEFKINKYLFSVSDIASTMLALTNIYPNLLENEKSYILAKHKIETSEKNQKKLEDKNSSSAIKVKLKFHESYKEDLEKEYDLDIFNFGENGFYEAYIYIESDKKEYDRLLLNGDKCEYTEPRYICEYIKNKVFDIVKCQL